MQFNDGSRDKLFLRWIEDAQTQIIVIYNNIIYYIASNWQVQYERTNSKELWNECNDDPKSVHQIHATYSKRVHEFEN
jgi:hypothetical protein